MAQAKKPKKSPTKKRKKTPKELKFKYYFPDDYKPVYTNGVWGGITPRGEIEIHFLYDRTPLPLYSSHELTKEKGLSGVPTKLEIGDFTLRFVQTGVVMDLTSAESLYEWLGDKLRDLRAAVDVKK